jgi:hypothetical protein
MEYGLSWGGATLSMNYSGQEISAELKTLVLQHHGVVLGSRLRAVRTEGGDAIAHVLYLQ